MSYVDFVSELHRSTRRNYVGRVISDDKAECAIIAKNMDMIIGTANANTVMEAIIMMADGRL
ncbi:hypothetical protein C823_005426 [Eubacterium plexicaudatum ASF492]|nr:hypothetical protein C823_005426 [Eubacterium plexicaudatum ASF492]